MNAQRNSHDQWVLRSRPGNRMHGGSLAEQDQRTFKGDPDAPEERDGDQGPNHGRICVE